MIRSIGYVLIFAACDYTDQTPSPTAVKLGDLDARLTVDVFDGQLELLLVTPGCDSLDSTITAVLDGVSGAVEPDGELVTMCEDFGHCDTLCTSPRFSWNLGEATGPGNFVIADDRTTWQVSIDRPVVSRTFELVPPTTTTFHSGEDVMLRMTPPSGSFAVAEVSVFTIGVTNESVVPDGIELSFTLPTLSVAAATELFVDADITLPATACQAPRGCWAPAQAKALLPVSVTP